MYKLAFALAVLLLLWIQSWFTTTTHIAVGDRHVFAYGWLAWLFLSLFLALLAGFSWLAWRWYQDRVLAGILLAGVPLVLFVSLPQTLCERVELSGQRLVHRREPPHTKYNADIPLADIQSATEIQAESGSFSTYYLFGYRLDLRDGRQIELPRGEVVTAAHETIHAALVARGIPVETEVVARPPPR
jgi:hypothetical protein